MGDHAESATGTVVHTHEDAAAARVAHKPSETPCNLCGATDFAYLYRDCPDQLFPSDDRFSLVRCAACAHVFVTPRLSFPQLDRFYPADYGSFSNEERDVRSRSWVRRALKTIAVLPYRIRFGSESGLFPPFGTGRLLDVGCGHGGNLREMKALGWDVYGCEPNRAAAEAARAVLGRDRIFDEPVETASLPPASFDAITFWHVLEHVPDPVATLRRAAQLLRPSGRIVIGVPNFDSAEARFFGRYWRGLEVPRHLSLFTPATLHRTIEQAGLRVQRMRPQLKPSTFSESIDLWLNERRGVRRHRQRMWVYYAAFLPAAWSYAVGNAGCLEATAVKDGAPPSDGAFVSGN